MLLLGADSCAQSEIQLIGRWFPSRQNGMERVSETKSSKHYQYPVFKRFIILWLVQTLNPQRLGSAPKVNDWSAAMNP